jgi:deoxyribonuclease V
MLRESKPIISVLNLLEHDFDVLLVASNGRFHPRRCGLACYVGIRLNKSVMGVAKSLLCGKEEDDNTILDD